jgi:hypothetical protein
MEMEGEVVWEEAVLVALWGAEGWGVLELMGDGGWGFVGVEVLPRLTLILLLAVADVVVLVNPTGALGVVEEVQRLVERHATTFSLFS